MSDEVLFHRAYMAGRRDERVDAPTPSKFTEVSVLSLTSIASVLYALRTDGTIWKTADNGATWNEVPNS